MTLTQNQIISWIIVPIYMYSLFFILFLLLFLLCF